MAEWLLTEQEAEEAVKAWTSEDYAVRIIRLGRGHWEDIAVVIAQAQLRKVLEKLIDRRYEGAGVVYQSTLKEIRREAGLEG